MARPPLPIDAVLPELLARLGENGAAVLHAPTGAGKTTRVPPALVENGAGLVLLVEPRRVAARAAARRMAAEHGSPLGETFGYHVRFDRQAGPRVRTVAVTPGILLRRLHDDPFLEAVSAVVFDEFHERGLESDLALGLVRLLRQTVRPDLHVIVMSATLDSQPISTYLGGCPVVRSEGRAFPVEIRYSPRRSDTHWPDATAAAVRAILADTPGDVLAFLPGVREIRQTATLLADVPAVVLPLHGELPPDQQDFALRKHEPRKIVLATNVAEASVTVDGVTAVIDTGVARQLEFDAGVGMDRLRLAPISRASADQRAGRAGRTAPGVCVRLWDEANHRSRAAQTEPEIRRLDLAGAALHLLAAGEDVAAFPWLDAPRPEAVGSATLLLDRLGATVDGRLTPLGRELAGLPVHPRVGRLLIEGAALGVPRDAALAAALLSEREPFDKDFGPPRPAASSESDLLDRVEVTREFERSGRLDSPLGRLHRGGAEAVLRARDQLLRLCPPAGEPVEDGLLQAVFAAYPDRLARRRGPGDRRALMVGGRGVTLAPSSAVREPELFVAVDVDAGGVESFVRLASGVRREWLPADLTDTRNVVVFDAETGKLAARKQTRFLDLVIADTGGHFADEAEATRVLATAAVERLADVLPLPNSAAGRFRTRVRCLRAWMPELDLPAFADADLRPALEELCRGKRSLADVRTGHWLDALRGALTYQQSQALEREAPDKLTVPTGSEIALEYAEGKQPVLAVRIQELFGLPATPRIAAGRVPVLLHLLAPNHRPQQVTADLASFWANGYPLVRKELRGRYPKHSWPDDPLAATAIRGPKRRPPG